MSAFRWEGPIFPQTESEEPAPLASTALGAAPFVEEALRWLPDTLSETAEEILPAHELLPVPCPPLADDKAGDQRPRILIADDNADMRQYLVRLLAERYDVQAVPDGKPPWPPCESAPRI